MQYILSSDEYEILVNRKKREEQRVIEDLQALCTMVADNKPVTPDARPWMCIKSVSYEWYCDGCPVWSYCPAKDKEWSK